MTKTKFYAVKAGYKPGIYTSWKSAFDQVNGFNSAEFKSFNTRKEAEKFISKCDDEDPTRKADYVYSCDSNKNKDNQALEDSEDCNTTQQYVLVDEDTIREEIENAAKSNSAQTENLWKYFDILMDIISDDGKRMKRIEEKRPTASERPTHSRIPSTLSPAILFPDTPQASEVNSVDSEPNEPCDDHTIIQKSVSQQSFTLQEPQGFGCGVASPGNSSNSGLNIFGDETMPNAQIENLLSSLKSESILLKSEIEKLQCNLRSLSLSNNNLREDNQILIAKENSLQDRIIVLEHALQAALEENNKLKEDEQWQQVQNKCYTNTNSQAKNPPTQVYFESQNSYEILRDLNDQTSAADPEDFENSQTTRRLTGKRNPERNKARRSRRKERVVVLGDSQVK